MAHPDHARWGQPAPGDPVEAWARQRGWHLGRNVSRRPLAHLRGPTYGPRDHLVLPVAAWGTHHDRPVLGMRFEHRWTAQVHYGSTASNTRRRGTTSGVHQVALVAMEAPAPLPDLGVYKRIGTVRRFLARLSGQSVASGGIDLGDVAGADRFRVESTQEAFARWFLTADVFQTIVRQRGVGSGGFFPAAQPDYEFFFTFTGRIVLVWCLIPPPLVAAYNGLDVVDTAVATAYWLGGRVPQQAYGPPSGWPGVPPGPTVQDLVAQL